MKKTLLVLLLTALGQCASADRIVLVYGDILEGKVVGETETTLTFRGEFGERTLLRSDIREIQAEGAPAQSPVAPPAPGPQGTASIPSAETPAVPTVSSNPTPYDILKKNVEMQATWNDLEIAYLQRSYIGGQTIQTEYIARIIPPDYLRANLTTPIPSTPPIPEAGEVE